jgi:hypothetical protein
MLGFWDLVLYWESMDAPLGILLLGLKTIFFLYYIRAKNHIGLHAFLRSMLILSCSI